MTAGGRSAAAFALVPVLFTLACAPGPENPADLVFRGGRIYRVTEEAPWAEALAVLGDRIVAVGSAADVEPWIGRDTRIVELEERLLLPGFDDGAVSLLAGAESLSRPLLGEAQSYAELLELVRVHAESRPEPEWVLGVGFRYHVLGRRPRRAELDAAVSDRPAFLLSQDRRAAWVSSRALEIAGVSPDSELLEDPGEIAAIAGVIPVRNVEERSELLEKAVAHLHRFGITGARLLDADGEALGPLALRIHGSSNRSTDERPHLEGVTRGGDASRYRGILLTVHPAKISPDWIPLARRRDDEYPLKRWVESGAVLVFGSDWPFAPIDPLLGLATAVTRQDPEGRPEGGFVPRERLTVAEAVAAYTKNGAFAGFEEDRRGTLEVGKLADLALLSEDIFSIPPTRILDVRVEMTVFGGRIVQATPFDRRLHPRLHSLPDESSEPRRAADSARRRATRAPRIR